MNVLFDNCTSPVLASTLDGFIKDQHRAYHIMEVPGLPNGRHSTDIEWIEHLRMSNLRWAFVSGDHRLLKNKAERAALRSAGLHGFILSPAHQTTPLHQVASLLIWQWPDMEQVTKLIAAPAMFEVAIGKSRKLTQLPL